MKELSDSLLRLAEEILPQIRLVFHRSDKAEEKDYNTIHFEIQKFISTLRGNEELASKVSRTDDDKAMVILVDLSEHEAMDGIVRELGKMARKLAKRSGLKVDVEKTGESD